MRLDHLLSKEHLARTRWVLGPDPRSGRTLLGRCSRVEHWLVDLGPCSAVEYSRQLSFEGVARRWERLLGMEDWVEARCWVLREQPATVVGLTIGPALRCTTSTCRGRRRVEGWGRPFLENCTVDASIFVVKLVRAHGGCLGTRSR